MINCRCASASCRNLLLLRLNIIVSFLLVIVIEIVYNRIEYFNPKKKGRLIMKKMTVLMLVLLLCTAALTACGQSGTPTGNNTGAATQAPKFTTPMERLGAKPQSSPEWVTKLDAAKNAQQLFVVAGYERSTAWISMHEKDDNGSWKMILSTPGFIGKEGLGKTKEGDGMTPVGTFRFNKAFGIADDPGCAIEYTKVDNNTYWSGDNDIQYNQLVSIKDYPNLKTDDSEHIVDYQYEYQYCLNISYNEEGAAGKGSAIFLHCLGDRKPRTGGCVAIPEEQMYYVMQHVNPDCVVVINSMEKLGAEF